MIREIVQKDDTVLRARAKEVPPATITSARIQAVIRDMRETLAGTPDGVALAAPQIGESLRIFVLSETFFPDEKRRVFINPVIVKRSRKTLSLDEGCLSVRWLYGKTRRAEKATVEARDEEGKKFSRGASGLLAQVFQHETGHLDGVLFTDHAKEVREVLPESASPRPLSIVFFGTPAFATSTLEALVAAGHTITCVVTQEDKPVGRSRALVPSPVAQWAHARKIPLFYDPLHTTCYQLLSTSDISIVVAYGKILPKEVIDAPRHGSVNVHYSLVPKYRGASPVQAAILNGDAETGVSIVLMDEKLDHGPILVREICHIEADEAYTELHARLVEIGNRLLVETLPLWVAGELVPDPQDHSKATTCTKISTEDGLLDLSKPEEAARKVRALNPNPGTYFFHEGKRIKVLSARVEKGTFRPLRVIPEGRREMDWFAYLRGRKT